MRPATKGFLVSLTLLSACVLAFALWGCAPQSKEQMSTGRVIAAQDLPGWKGDTAYGEINSAWLKGFYIRWKADLFRKGVVKWEKRFDCNRFAAHFAAEAQIAYYIENFHSWTDGRAAAVGEIWYLVDGQKDRGHAIVLAYTERGPVYIEPQTGKEVTLTSAERESVYFMRF
jgi:hypothetical protein